MRQLITVDLSFTFELESDGNYNEEGESRSFEQWPEELKQLLDGTVGYTGERLFGWSNERMSIEVGDVETVDL